MKKIIVPLDFSETSLCALKTAITIANKLQADLSIVYVAQKEKYAKGYEQLDATSGQGITALLDKLLLEHRQEYYVAGGKMDYKVRTGIVYEEIIGQSKYDDAVMIVMGSHGVSGIMKSWIGGNAYRVLCTAQCPVLVIRPDMQYSERFNRVVVPVELSKASRYKIPAVGGVCKLFGAKATLIGVRRSGIRAIFNRITTSVHQVEKFLVSKGIEVEKTTVLSGSDVNEQFIEAIQLQDADLVMIDVTPSGLLTDRFRPFLITLVNSSKCPVMAIPIKEE
ncbi:MAG: universal stress protein [Marinilabiliaceae bacterium]|nr:universal stress protein [Marinilabiliaceae bacterium]